MLFTNHIARSIFFTLLLLYHMEVNMSPASALQVVLKQEESYEMGIIIEEIEEENRQLNEMDEDEDEVEWYYDEEDEKDEEHTHWTINNAWYDMGCEEVFSSERPIHSPQKWKEAIQIYQTIVQNSKLDPVNNGFSVGVEAKQADQSKGRGIYATHPIKKGDLVWSTKRTARFDNADDYKLFISKLETGFACDVIQWAYVQDINDSEEEEELKISVDLDEGCFCNGEGFDGLPGNVGCDEDAAMNFKGGCKSNYFALDDIKAGEEFICKYGEFAIPGGWGKFGI